MARRSIGNSQTGSMVLTIVAVVVFVWGLERWRKNAAHEAGHSERGRLMTFLVRSFLWATLVYNPNA